MPARVGPPDVESVRVGEHGGVPVGGGQTDDDNLAAPHRLSGDLGVTAGHSCGELDGESSRRISSTALAHNDGSSASRAS